MPPELKEHLQNKAVKIWKMALAQREATATTTAMADVTTTTVNKAEEMLLSGIDGHPAVELAYTPQEAPTTTTTTTEDQAAMMQMYKAAKSRLTDGMGKLDLEEQE